MNKPKAPSVDQPLNGAYSSLESMISARFLAKDLQLQQRRKALSLLAGPNKTRFRGRGLDFEEVRAYQPGDDIRSIDWRVTARSGKAYTKLFSEERERPMLVVTDQRQAMFFGSQHCFKSVTACYISALLAWSGLQQGDRVGGLVFGNDDQQELRPRRSRQSVLGLIQLLDDYNHRLNRDSGIASNAAQRLVDTLLELRRIAKPGSSVYFLSDFEGFENDQVQKRFYQLSRHCEVTAIYIYDPLERSLPPAGQYTVSDGQQRRQIETGAKKMRRHYAQHFKQRLEQLHQQLAKVGVPLIEVSTDHAPLQRLREFYGNR